MKWVLRILLIFVLSSWGYGGYLNLQEEQGADAWFGIGILVLALVLMPLFLWHRYKSRKLEDYIFKFDNENGKKSENQ